MRPEISVVIPTRRRETRLAFALQALAEQTLAPERFEVIVVRPAEDAGLPQTDAPGSVSVRFLRSPVAGTAAQRNHGWQAAEAPIVAFTDDDCRPEPEWLASLLAVPWSEGTIVQGATDPDPDEIHLLTALARSIRVPPIGWYQTCNIAYSRSLLERVGGFDEGFDFLGEDTDLGVRATRTGAAFRFTPTARVKHAVYWRSPWHALADIWKRRTLPGLVARHPEQREMLWLGVFTDPGHLQLLVALAGLTVARRAPLLAAIAVYPYVRRRFDPNRTGAWGMIRFTMHLFSRGAVDFVQIAVYTAGSIRHRTLVL